MQTVIGVVRGGPSDRYEDSLRTGATMLKHLPSDRFAVRDFFIDRAGVWHDRGRPVAPERALRQVDAALLGLSGSYGASGDAQELLARFGVPYAGADHLGVRLAAHALLSKLRAKEAGLLTPEFEYGERSEGADAIAYRVVRRLHQPVMVRPIGRAAASQGAVAGGYAPVLREVETAFVQGADAVLIEESVRGKPMRVGVVEGLRGEELYALPVVETIARTGRIACPGNVSRVVREELRRAARLMHRALGLRHYSFSSFAVVPKGLYYLGTEALPSLSPDADLPTALAAIGVTPPDFFAHLVNLALSR